MDDSIRSQMNDDEGLQPMNGEMILVPRELAETLATQMRARHLTQRNLEKVTPKSIGAVVEMIMEGVKRLPNHMAIQLERAEKDLWRAKKRLARAPKSVAAIAYLDLAANRLAAVLRTVEEGQWFRSPK